MWVQLTKVLRPLFLDNMYLDMDIITILLKVWAITLVLWVTCVTICPSHMKYGTSVDYLFLMSVKLAANLGAKIEHDIAGYTSATNHSLRIPFGIINTRGFGHTYY